MNEYTHVDISQVLLMAAACVRECGAARQLAGTLPDEDEGINCTLIQLIDELPVCLVADHLDDLVHEDVVCIDVQNTHAIIAVVTPEGRCNRPEIVSHEQIISYLAAVDTNILLPHTRYNGKRVMDGKRVMVFAGKSAIQIAQAAGGLGVLCPFVFD